MAFHVRTYEGNNMQASFSPHKETSSIKLLFLITILNLFIEGLTSKFSQGK